MMPSACDLSGKVALVTGAQRGIGAEVARLLAAAGAHVIVGYVVEPERAGQLCKEINAAGGKAFSTCFDVTDSLAVTKAFEQIAELYGRLDILVNNAGRRVDNLALKMSDEQWRQSLAVNLDGVFYCCRAALALMRKTGGSIVNVSSIAAFTGSLGQANYAAAKAGVVGLTRSLAVEYGSRGIRVNCVVPGIIETEMTADLKPAFRTELLERIPLKRFGEPADVAQAVLFLASEAAAYISGVTLHINGGGYPS
jgi:3-oxoacyl-[acyl-carrier protein] reductase